MGWRPEITQSFISCHLSGNIRCCRRASEGIYFPGSNSGSLHNTTQLRVNSSAAVYQPFQTLSCMFCRALQKHTS